MRDYLLRQLRAEERDEPTDLLRGESGSAMVEFAIMFWPQFCLTLMMLQFLLLQYAYIVVKQGAEMGARAAAVSDLMGRDGTRMDPTDAVRRVAARHCALLAPGVDPDQNLDGNTFTGGTQPTDGELTWTSQGGQLGFTTERQKQAYALLTVNPADVTVSGGEARCVVTFDYVMPIPVGGSLLVALNPSARTASAARGGSVWPVSRVGWSTAPWVR